MTEDHTDTVFTRIQRDQGGRRHADVHRLTTEAGIEADPFIGDQQITHRTGCDIEHDLAVLDVLTRHLDTFLLGVHHDVRRIVVIQQPLVECACQIRATGKHGRTS